MPHDHPYEGGCVCGHVRYRLRSAPMFVHCCHCRECQRASGAAFAINMLIEENRIELLEGTAENVTTPTPSGEGQITKRCTKCRVALWSEYVAMTKRSNARVGFVRAGTLDNPDAITPDIHIHTVSKLPWLILPDGSRVVPHFYDAQKVWPDESLQRLSAIKN